MAGSATLTVQVVVALLDLHMLHDAWMYADMQSVIRALRVWGLIYLQASSADAL